MNGAEVTPNDDTLAALRRALKPKKKQVFIKKINELALNSFFLLFTQNT